jgi:hypothetical protein
VAGGLTVAAAAAIVVLLNGDFDDSRVAPRRFGCSAWPELPARTPA